jgi:hypothetical protein
MKITMPTATDRYAHVFTRNGRFAVAWPKSPVYLPLLQSVIDALQSVETEGDKLAANPNLSNEGRAGALQPTIANALTTLRRAELDLEKLSTERRASLASLYSTGTVVDAAADREIRAEFPNLGARESQELNAAMAAGKADDVLRALLRNPIPQAVPLAARALWEQRVRAVNGIHIDALQAREQEEDELLTTFGIVRRMLTDGAQAAQGAAAYSAQRSAQPTPAQQ